MEDSLMSTSKVFLLTHEFPPKRGGAGVYCEEMAYAATTLDQEMEVWAPSFAKGWLDGNLFPLHLKGSQDWLCSFRLVQAARKRATEFSGNAVHLAEPGALRAFIRFGVSLFESTRLIVTLHGSEIPRFTRFFPERFLFRRLLRKTDVIHVLSRHNQDALLRKFPELEPKILLSPGAPSRHVVPAEADRTIAGGKEKLRIITVGRLHPRKGQDCMLAALATLPNELKDSVEYILVGPETHSRYVTKLREQSEKIGLSVKFSGDLSDEKLREAYATADVFALTSTAQPKSVEGFGFVYLEAASHGLPAIAHRIGGVEDAVVDEETGLLIEHDRPADLSRAIERLLRDSQLRERLGNAAKERADTFTWESTAKALYA